MREHPAQIRYTLMACFVHVRTSEVTDDVTRMMLELIRKIDKLIKPPALLGCLTTQQVYFTFSGDGQK